MVAAKKKVVVVGDGNCGKTCMLLVYKKEEFIEEYIPTVFEDYMMEVDVDKTVIQIELIDTAGQEEYDRLRPLGYYNTDVFILTFSIADPDTLENITTKWIPELRHFCPRTPIVLVGMKKDLRWDDTTIGKLRKRKKEPVSSVEGEELAMKVAEGYYVECSAKTNEGIDDVFHTAARLAVKAKKVKPGRRTRACQMF